MKKESLEKLLKNLFASATGDKYFLEEQPALTVEHLDDEASVNAYIPDEKSDSSTSENHLPVESNEEGKDLLMGVVDQIDQSGL